MKTLIVFLALVVACLPFALSKQNPQAGPQSPPASPATAKPHLAWMVSGLSNVHKDSDEDAGHGIGDLLTVVVRDEIAVGSLTELEGSQEDPPPTCLTGSFRNGLLSLQSHPEDFYSQPEQIRIRGKLYPVPHGNAFHGTIAGGPYHSDPKSTDPHFPGVVTLRVRDEHYLEDAADELATGSCACEWKKHVAAKDFVTAKCPAIPSN
jgi:hypothetical protein